MKKFLVILVALVGIGLIGFGLTSSTVVNSDDDPPLCRKTGNVQPTITYYTTDRVDFSLQNYNDYRVDVRVCVMHRGEIKSNPKTITLAANEYKNAESGCSISHWAGTSQGLELDIRVETCR